MIPTTGELGWHVHWHPLADAGNLHSPSPGIISHNLYERQKVDGWFQALYSWLRLQHFDGDGLSAEDVYDRAQEIAASDETRNIRGNKFIVMEHPG